MFRFTWVFVTSGLFQAAGTVSGTTREMRFCATGVIDDARDRNWYVIRSGKRDNIIDLFTWTAKPARWSVFMHQDLTRDLQRLYHAQITIIYRRVPARLLIQTLRGINWLLREGEPLREKSLCVLKIYFDPTINCTRKNWYLVRFLTHFRVRSTRLRKARKPTSTRSSATVPSVTNIVPTCF